MTTLAIAGRRSAGEILAWSRALIDADLRAAVDRLPDAMRRIAGYHFGFCDPDGMPAAGYAGKAVRPALVLLCARAVGGEPRDAVPAGVAVELVHNFSLLHDDVMDEDRARRNRLTAWAVFGAGPAVLAGDAVLAAASDVLARSAPPWAASAVRRLGEDVVALCEGQFADLAFEQRAAVSVEECLAMAAGKTGALLGGSCALGGLAGGADEGCVGLLAAFGRQLGLAFQLRDDLLGIWGDPALTGKPVGSDVMRRKKSFPVIAALASGTAAGAELAELYQRHAPLRADEVARATDLIEQAGGRDLARDEAASQLAQALASLDAVGCASTARDELITIAHLMVDRHR